MLHQWVFDENHLAVGELTGSPFSSQASRAQKRDVPGGPGAPVPRGYVFTRQWGPRTLTAEVVPDMTEG